MLEHDRFRHLRHLSLAVIFCVASLSGCKDNPGKWPPDKVAIKVAESLEVSDLTLTASEKGLEGTGKRSDGELITVVVNQDADNGKISWDAKGDRGFVETGSYSLSQ